MKSSDCKYSNSVSFQLILLYALTDATYIFI